MSQDYTDDCFDPAHAAQTDMANIEKNFAALKSAFSGTNVPANAVAGMRWFHTANKLLKLRNSTNTAWLGIMSGNSGTKIWIYSNTAADGWVVDSSVADKVLAIKGGSNAYAVAGGSNAGTWTQPGHVLTEAEIPAHSHNIEDNTHSHAIKTYNNSGTGSSGIGLSTGFLQGTKNTEEGTHSHGCGVTGSSSSHNHGSTYRPAAAVGTLQYLNI